MTRITGAMRAARMIGALALGATIAMAQQQAGTLRGWGSNGNRELGNGLAGDSSVPQSVQALTNVIAVAVGGANGIGGYTLALESDGSVWAWGNDGLNQLGSVIKNGFAPLPVPVPAFGPGSGVIAIAAGDGHSLALKADGSVWAWGWNGNGQLGNGVFNNPEFNPVPAQVLGLGPGSGVIAIGAGFAHSVALKADGTVLAWGFNGRGQLGLGNNAQQGDRNTPVIVSGMGSNSGVIAIAVGADHNLALKSDGSVDGWGDNAAAELGIGNQTLLQSASPLGVSGLGSGAGIIAIGAGSRHSLALKADGTVLAWGNNLNGQVGNGDATRLVELTPVQVTGLGSGSGVIAVSGGENHTVALRSDGTVLTWGNDRFGQLGIGAAIGLQAPDSFAAVQVTNLNGVVAIGVGANTDHAMAIVQPVAALSTTAINFGDQLVGTLSASRTITIQNNGQDPLIINNVSLNGASTDFKVSAPPTPFTIAQGTTVSISVAFDPTAAFARLATLLIDGNAFSAPQFVALSGNGLAQADVAVAIGADSTRVKNGGNLTYTISVSNSGPTLAPDVVVTDALPTEMTFVSSKTSQGACSTPAPGTTGTVTCKFASINTGATATITLTVAVHSAGAASVVNTVSAAAQAPDSNLANNSATTVTSVFGSKK